MRNKYRFSQVMGLVVVLFSGMANAFDQSLIDKANQVVKPMVKAKLQHKAVKKPKHHKARQAKEAEPEVELKYNWDGAKNLLKS